MIHLCASIGIDGMHYHVKQRSQVLGTFPLFVDAWLFVVLNTTSYCTIIDSEGDKWIVNPRSHDIN